MVSNMFTPALRPILCAAAMLVLSSHPWLYSQDPVPDPGMLYRNSLADFDRGDYRSALAGFLSLKDRQPANAMHGYYAGRCLVELNEDLDDAIELLYGASKKQVPSDVNFYLGMAYHRDYNFSEAIRYYGRFEIEASRQEIKECNVKHLISTCRSALEITATYNQYEVMTVTFLDLSDSAEFSQIRMKGGQLQRKPAQYFSPDEDREGLNSLMFIPEQSLRGDHIFFAGYNRSGKDGLQLFRVKKGSGRAWGDPVEIKALSTEGDEILPYYDPIEQDLYYASDGGEGIGGFDLYRAHYDLENDEWTDAINLGFPINSVMDEYLLLPGSDLGMMMFFSTRQGTDSTVTVYRVHLVEPKKKTDANNTRMLKEIANLGGVAEEILAEIRTISDRTRRSTDDVPGKSSETAEDGTGPVITPVTVLSPGNEPSKEKPAYHEILAEALMHQAASDSLKDLASSARARIRESDDPNERWVWQKQIMVWEKKAQDREEMADALYANVETENTADQEKPAVNTPEVVESGQPVEEEPDTQPEVEPEPVRPAHGYINRFDILGRSPYNEGNPIPVNVTLPSGVFYRIQLGAFGQAVEPDAFKGISPITAEIIEERGLIKYYAGKFSEYGNASDALTRIRNSGHEDAFIVAWYNGSPVSTQKAKQLE